MFDGKKSIPIVIRMIVGRGWGQGPQHSQSLQSIFAHIPGLKVVMPSTAESGQKLLMNSFYDKNQSSSLSIDGYIISKELIKTNKVSKLGKAK